MLPVIREMLFKESDQELRQQRADKKEREKNVKANAWLKLNIIESYL